MATTTTTTEAPLPVTPVQWTTCGDDLQCGSVTAPLDYTHPDGSTIQIAVERRPANDPSARIGSLVINPGGPGTSGVSDMANELSVMPPALLDDFDIVTFDPRGVDRSSPVGCGPPTSGSSPNPVPTTPAGQQALWAADKDYAAACEQYSGSILPYVGTVEAADDLDRIRAALGDARLTYMGQSYGTLLGATYAQMFPTHVRAMVLDGAIDPALSSEQFVIDQSEGFEESLTSFFLWCSTAHCAWRPTVDPTTAVLDLIDQAGLSPLPAGDGQTAGPGDIYDALLAGLYSESDWPRLAAALSEAAAGDGGGVLAMTTTYNTAGSSNLAEANTAINCLDHPTATQLSAYPQMAAAAGASAPVFGPLLAWGLLQCAMWPAPPTRQPEPTTAAGSNPILVEGATGDPATPYEWAQHLAAELQHGELVTWQGMNHVSYFYSSCIRAIDQNYLVAGTLPPVGTVCRD